MRIGRLAACLLFLGIARAFAGEPVTEGAARKSLVPHRRVRRTYENRVQMHGSEAAPSAETPPVKEGFVPGEVDTLSGTPPDAIARPTSFSPGPAAPAREKAEEDDRPEKSLWILDSATLVLGVSTNSTTPSHRSGWLVEELAARNQEKSEEEEASGDSEEDPESPFLGLLTNREPGPYSLQHRTSALSSNAAERARSPSAGSPYLLSSEPDSKTDSFVPLTDSSTDRFALLQDAQAQLDQASGRRAPAEAEPTAALPEPARSDVPEAISRSPAPSGSFSTKWEPPTLSSPRSQDLSVGEYGRVGAIFSPIPDSRPALPLSRSLPDARPGGLGSPVPDVRYRPFGEVRTELPPVQNLRTAFPARTETKPFLPGRYEP